MTAEKPTFLKRLLGVDRRYIYAIAIVLLVWPLLQPWMLPISIHPWTKEYYDTIEKLPPGAKVLTVIDFEAGLVGELGSQAVTTLQHLFDKPNLKFVQAVFYRGDCQVVFETQVLPKVDKRGKQYGVDWVNIGYLEGKETAMSAFAANFMYAQKDAYGHPLDTLPLMKEIKSMKDVDLYLTIQGGDYILTSIRQFAVPYNKPCLAGSMSMTMPDLIPFKSAGIIGGILNGLPGAAQYEYLRKKPGIALRSMDALSALHIFLLGLIIVTNAAYFALRRRGEKR
jgi:hypothetical protein